MYLTKRQLYVLNLAHARHLDDSDYGDVITCHAGEWSVSSNTCKSLVKLGLLSETNMRNRFHITKQGMQALIRGVKVSSRTKPSDKLAKWNRAAGRKVEQE